MTLLVQQRTKVEMLNYFVDLCNEA